jgi:hypothetical protein
VKAVTITCGNGDFDQQMENALYAIELVDAASLAGPHRLVQGRRMAEAWRRHAVDATVELSAAPCRRAEK